MVIGVVLVVVGAVGVDDVTGVGARSGLGAGGCGCG